MDDCHAVRREVPRNQTVQNLDDFGHIGSCCPGHDGLRARSPEPLASLGEGGLGLPFAGGEDIGPLDDRFGEDPWR